MRADITPDTTEAEVMTGGNMIVVTKDVHITTADAPQPVADILPPAAVPISPLQQVMECAVSRGLTRSPCR